MSQTQFEKLKDIVKDLRHPTSGCPWDLKQTHQSLLKYLLEESYEFIEAVELESPEKMEEEIGDVLLQVLLHSQMASEKKWFDIESVSEKLKEKLIRRHPHVFETPNSNLSAEQVLVNWEQIKKEERERENQEKANHHRIKKSVLHAPALSSAQKIGQKTNELKFDWEHFSQVSYKVEEEWQELKEELSYANGLNKNRVKEELGDLLFSIAQLARHLEIDPEAALKEANIKFLRRFYDMEDLILKNNLTLENMNQEQMDVYWLEAKVREKNNKK